MIMGIKFPPMAPWLKTLAFGLFFLSFTVQQVIAEDFIELPKSPRAIPPPLNKEEVQRDFDESIDRMRERREEQQKLDYPEASYQQIKSEKLYEEAREPRPHQFHMQVSLVKPFINVQSPRKKYQLDLTSHSSFFYRPQTSLKETQAQLWTGFRLAPFSGTGTYDNVSGRFGFTYFGPMIGVGKINEIVLDSEKGQKPAKGQEDLRSYPSRFGFFAMTGIAIQSREIKIFAEDKKGEKEFESKKFAFDAPGLWGELTLSYIFYEAVSANFVLGVQTGNGKVMAWSGLAMGAWY